MMITRVRCIENSALALMARVSDVSGEHLTQATTAAVTLAVFDRQGNLIVPADAADPDTYDGTALDPADVVYDALVTDDPRWTADDTGYNVALVLDGSYVPEAGQHQAELKIEPTNGPAFYVLWRLDALNIWSE